MHDEERIHMSEEDVTRLDEIAGPRGICVVGEAQFTADALRAPQTIPLGHIAHGMVAAAEALDNLGDAESLQFRGWKRERRGAGEQSPGRVRDQSALRRTQ